MKKICIIPARMNSSRFPGKPLAKALGIPLVIHVAKRGSLVPALFDSIAVATCDQAIANVCKEYGITALLTSPHHERCTERVAEAVDKYYPNLDPKDCVVMLQGDEILVTPEMLESVLEIYQHYEDPVINLLSKLYSSADYYDPNVVKVVTSVTNKALYFSRSPIPSDYRNKHNAISAYQQTGVIAFSRQFLHTFTQLKQTKLEKVESIDMLRILEHGLPIKIVTTDIETIAVDVPADLERAAKKLLTDPLINSYAPSCAHI